MRREYHVNARMLDVPVVPCEISLSAIAWWYLIRSHYQVDAPIEIEYLDPLDIDRLACVRHNVPTVGFPWSMAEIAKVLTWACPQSFPPTPEIQGPDVAGCLKPLGLDWLATRRFQWSDLVNTIPLIKLGLGTDCLVAASIIIPSTWDEDASKGEHILAHAEPFDECSDATIVILDGWDDKYQMFTFRYLEGKNRGDGGVGRINYHGIVSHFTHLELCMCVEI